jgi:hypothetical protein
MKRVPFSKSLPARQRRATRRARIRQKRSFLVLSVLVSAAIAALVEVYSEPRRAIAAPGSEAPELCAQGDLSACELLDTARLVCAMGHPDVCDLSLRLNESRES